MVQGLWHMTGAKALIENGEAKKRKPLHRQKKTMRGLTPMRPVEVELESSCAANHFLVNCMMKHAVYCEGHHIPLAGKLQKSCQHGDAKARLWP